MMSGVAEADPKGDLRRYLQRGRKALLWKLDGLSEYDIRRPMTPTGTNLLGLVKHVAAVEAGYFGVTFGRPFEPERASGKATWTPTPTPTCGRGADESREYIVDLYHRVWAHSDVTIDTLDLDSPGRVPWWPDDVNEVTLHRILVHIIDETESPRRTRRHRPRADRWSGRRSRRQRQPSVRRRGVVGELPRLAWSRRR